MKSKEEIIDKILNESNGSWKDIAEESFDEGVKFASQLHPSPSPAPVEKEAKGKETIKDYLERRIKELYDADATFCKDRWNMNLGPNERGLAREMSNQVTFARQELQEALKYI